MGPGRTVGTQGCVAGVGHTQTFSRRDSTRVFTQMGRAGSHEEAAHSGRRTGGHGGAPHGQGTWPAPGQAGLTGARTIRAVTHMTLGVAHAGATGHGQASRLAAADARAWDITTHCIPRSTSTKAGSVQASRGAPLGMCLALWRPTLQGSFWVQFWIFFPVLVFGYKSAGEYESANVGREALGTLVGQGCYNIKCAAIRTGIGLGSEGQGDVSGLPEVSR